MVKELTAAVGPSRSQPSGDTEYCVYATPLKVNEKPMAAAAAVGVSSFAAFNTCVAPVIGSSEAPALAAKASEVAPTKVFAEAFNCELPLKQVGFGVAVAEENAGALFTTTTVLEGALVQPFNVAVKV